jgi:hypothetical protein
MTTKKSTFIRICENWPIVRTPKLSFPSQGKKNFLLLIQFRLIALVREFGTVCFGTPRICLNVSILTSGRVTRFPYFRDGNIWRESLTKKRSK